MKVKNLIIGIIAIAVIGVIIFFALKMTKDIKNNDVNSANVVEAESEEVVNDASNVIEDGNGGKYPMVHQVWEISDASHTSELWFKIGSTRTSIFGWTKEVYGIAKGTDIFQEFTEEMRIQLEKEKEVEAQ